VSQTVHNAASVGFVLYTAFKSSFQTVLLNGLSINVTARVIGIATPFKSCSLHTFTVKFITY